MIEEIQDGTTADYLSQLLLDKHNLVVNLNDKNVTVTDTETFSTLVPKILDIVPPETEEDDVRFFDYDGTLINYDYVVSHDTGTGIRTS